MKLCLPLKPDPLYKCTHILYNGTQGVFAFRIYSREYETCTRGVGGVYNGETYWLQSAIIPPPSLPQPPPALICPNSHRGVFNHLIKNFGPGLKDKADAIASWRLQKNSEGNFLSILDATPTLWFLRFVFVTFFEQLLNGDQTDIILQPCFF